MRTTFLPFCLPSISELEVEAVVETARSGWITTGPRVAEFEQQFAEFCQSGYAVTTSSGTAGMHVVLKALGIGPGDEVITPSMTWVSTVNLILQLGATPVFVDVERDTLLTTADLIAPLITERTRLIIPVHYAGAPVDLDPIRELAERHGIPVVEDAAHAVGTVYKGRPIGSSGTAIFSFHPIKNITTGEGGMTCTDDANLAEHVRRLRFHGLGADAHDRHTQGRSPQVEVQEPGFKYNMTDLAASIGLVQLKRLDELTRRRMELVKRYRNELKTLPGLLPLSVPTYDHTHAWHLMIVRVDPDRAGMTREQFMEQLKARNIGSGIHFKAVHTHAYYRRNPVAETGHLTQTDWNTSRICSLPFFPGMKDKDLDDVFAALHEIMDTV